MKIYYLFDYGDEWWHEVTYEGIKDCKEKEYPSVLLKKVILWNNIQM